MSSILIMWRYALFILSMIPSGMQIKEEWRLVRTAQGPVCGRKESDGVYAYYNIPYAIAPTGENKFKPPLPPPQWSEPLEATNKGIVCPQIPYEPDLDTKLMQEDCLIANVFVPDTNNTNLSVVLNIHGGAFLIGYGDRRKAKQLMKTKKIIFVTFNYRLGIHGFLCLGTKDVPGNAGMKDMVAMLHWLKKNIASFGGNPDDITISGYSAGAVAADLLILSKSANGLFKKVIIESGSNAATFAIQSDPLQIAKDHAKYLNFTNVDDLHALEKFYKTMSYDVLTIDNEFLERKDTSYVFVPCVERDKGEGVFLHDSPINILKSGDYAKVPMLYGFTSMEGLMCVPYFESWSPAMNARFSDFLPPDLTFSSDGEKAKVTKQIKKFYFGKKSVHTGTILNYINFFTDVIFASPALRSVSLNVASGNNEIYLYFYTFVDENEPPIPFTKNLRGADHCAQSFAIFDDLKPKNSTVKSKMMRKILRKIWHNFIITGSPVTNRSSPLIWPPTTVNRSPFMSFGQTLKLGTNLLKTRARFWDIIYQKYYRNPESPPAVT